MYDIAPRMKRSSRFKNKSQLEFAKNKDLKSFGALSFGGEKLKKKRKAARPLIPGKITHLVLKSSKANGRLCLYKNRSLVNRILDQKSKLFFVEILDLVNMGNHLHLKVRFKDPKRLSNFLRTCCGLIARKIASAEKGRSFGKFWEGLAYTRVLITSFEELGLRIYFEGNHRQRELGYQERISFLKRWNEYLSRLRNKRNPQ